MILVHTGAEIVTETSLSQSASCRGCAPCQACDTDQVPEENADLFYQKLLASNKTHLLSAEPTACLRAPWQTFRIPKPSWTLGNETQTRTST